VLRCTCPDLFLVRWGCRGVTGLFQAEHPADEAVLSQFPGSISGPLWWIPCISSVRSEARAEYFGLTSSPISLSWSLPAKVFCFILSSVGTPTTVNSRSSSEARAEISDLPVLPAWPDLQFWDPLTTLRLSFVLWSCIPHALYWGHYQCFPWFMENLSHHLGYVDQPIVYHAASGFLHWIAQVSQAMVVGKCNHITSLDKLLELFCHPVQPITLSFWVSVSSVSCWQRWACKGYNSVIFWYSLWEICLSSNWVVWSLCQYCSVSFLWSINMNIECFLEIRMYQQRSCLILNVLCEHLYMNLRHQLTTPRNVCNSLWFIGVV